MLKILALIIACLMVSGAPADAQQKSQLALSVENRLVSLGFSVDASQFDTSTLGQLHLTLSSRDNDAEKRRKIQNILEKAGYGG